LVPAAPEVLGRNALGAGAYLAARNGGPEQLRKNLARVIGVAPEEVPDSLIRASLASYARYWREAFRLPSMDHVELGRRLDVENIETVWAAMEKNGRGAVLALPHSGNWDMAGVWMVQNHGRFATVAERLKPESLYNRFLAYRESVGFEVVPTSGGERPPFDVLCDRLRDNGVVCLMADRDMTRNGVQVDFFGEPSRLPAGPAKLALNTAIDAQIAAARGDHQKAAALFRDVLVGSAKEPNMVWLAHEGLARIAAATGQTSVAATPFRTPLRTFEKTRSAPFGARRSRWRKARSRPCGRASTRYRKARGSGLT